MWEYCEATGKRKYTKKAAQTEINTATKKHWKNRAYKIPKRCYLCDFCNFYHLTSEVSINAKRRKEREHLESAGRRVNERRRIERMETDLRRYSREYR